MTGKVFFLFTLSVKQKIIKQKWIPAITAVGYMSYGKLHQKIF